jgi:large subunit ribosomal protein L5
MADKTEGRPTKKAGAPDNKAAAPKAEKTAKAAAPAEVPTPPRLKDFYNSEVAPALMKKYDYKSPMQIPKFVKVVVNVGVSEARENAKAIDVVINDITQITGQKAVATTAKKSVANFKLREGMKIGVKVTLRGDRMYEFIDRLFNFSLPRVRDFRGINPNGFDGRGNYSLGLREQLIFPEIVYDKIDKVRGMDIAFVTTARTDEEARDLITMMGAPFAK